ncbi:MAG: arylsulfatase [Acidobacteria bacterium]|nr:arylsulfatase [Acidobacteriota bacterium]
MRTLSRRGFLGAAACAGLHSAPARPNIIYILADDLGWGDPRCYNPNSAIPTPNMDRLAAQGMRFTDMHSPSSVCTPTRYGIMTGRYAWRTRLKRGVLWGWDTNLIEPGRATVASLLKSNGYATGGVGKWHLGLGDGAKTDYAKPFALNPTSHGFDWFFGIPASLDMDPYVYFENDRATEQPTAQTPGRNEPRGVFWRPGPIAPGLKIEEVLPVLGGKALGFIRDRARQPDKPFFLYFPLTGPHTPWMPLERFRGKSGAGDYGDFVVQVDDLLGQVMATLDETGLARNTLLIFTSDNGANWTPEDRQKFTHRANAAWRGQKADIQEGGHRIPFIARWPGRIKPGSVSSQLGCLTDLMATVAGITGAELGPASGEDSHSLVPAFEGKAGTRQAIVHHSSEGVFSVRQGSWKLILGRGSGGFSLPKTIPTKPGEPAGELYDLASDPGETINLYAAQPHRVLELTALLDRYRSQGRSR